MLFHLALFGAIAGALFAVAHGPVAMRDAAGLALGVAAWAVTAALEHRVQPRKPGTTDAADTPWRVLALVMLQLTLPTAALTSRYSAPALTLGALLLACGAALRLWSLAALGRHFTWTTGLVAGHVVVRSGPYRYMKHPNYLGSVIFALGVAVAAGSTAALAPVAVLAAAAAVTARHEEGYLRTNLPGYH